MQSSRHSASPFRRTATPLQITLAVAAACVATGSAHAKPAEEKVDLVLRQQLRKPGKKEIPVIVQTEAPYDLTSVENDLKVSADASRTASASSRASLAPFLPVSCAVLLRSPA